MKNNCAKTQCEKRSPQPWAFTTRWRIEGCLFTLTSLHIGSGGIIHHPDLNHDVGPVEISAHCVDGKGCPCIFGSTLKGNVRSWLEASPNISTTLIEEVLGKGPEESEGEDRERMMGGRADFHDAHLSVTRTEPTPLPCWNPSRQTWIEATNSINRHTRTTRDEHLVHTECVPPGVGFDVVISGFFDDSRQVGLLLAALEGFNHPRRPLTLGAHSTSGKGRFRWEMGRMYKMDKAAVLHWVNNPDRGMAEDAMLEVQGDELALIKQIADGFRQASTSTPHWTEIPITLNFDSHFLVNDPPSQREMDESVDEEGNKTLPDHRPRMDEMGEVVLPAKSFRGAFRAQAERILRTLGGHACDPTAAGDDPNCCKSIEKLTEDCPGQGADKSQLCLACQIFGAPGWRTPLEIGEFFLKPGGYPCEIQEFVAIDRFTGGGKASAKFNAKAIYQPVFHGCLEIDESRLPPSGLGLMALTLRDLMEGDITLGFGAAKGYGTCTAKIPIWEDDSFRKRVSESLVELKQVLEQEEG